MKNESRKIAAQYEDADLMDKIEQGLKKAGKSLDNMTPEDIAGVDEFHIRGRESTSELAELLDLRPGSQVLDVGCGLGGACRYLATRYEVSVTGIDLTTAYCRAATEFAKIAGLQQKVKFQQADACDLPFGDAEFDRILTIHAQMNIKDKQKFYGEIKRVLKSGGLFGFYDIFAGKNSDLFFPVPWADDTSVSWLKSPEQIRNLLESLDFSVISWHDDTDRALDWFKKMAAKVREWGPPPVGLHLLMGPNAPDKMRNMIGNLDSGKLSIVRATLKNR